MELEQKTIHLSYKKNTNWKRSLEKQVERLNSCVIELNSEDILFTYQDIQFIDNFLRKSGITIKIIRSKIAETIVSCQTANIPGEFYTESLKDIANSNIVEKIKTSNIKPEVLFHKGTLRSGELLESETDLLIVGDVNPGALIKAKGNIMIWGRFLGTGHAGMHGDNQKTISALQLRPVQLRIADKVARGPKERSVPGLAEQARIQSGEIVICPITTF